ncbi:Protein C05C9.1 [Aphelenchoides avenae]|nr:Protein C05C9.1 [Aphelenchus avenae]
MTSRHRTSARDPVLKLEITCEADIKMKMTDRKLEVELKLKNSRAILVESKIENMSQKTVDVIMSMSVPFLEQAVEIFVGEGVEVKEFLRIPSQNESMRVENGYIRLQADLNLQNLL